MNKSQKIKELRRELVELKEVNQKLHNSILENLDRIKEIEEILAIVEA